MYIEYIEYIAFFWLKDIPKFPIDSSPSLIGTSTSIESHTNTLYLQTFTANRQLRNTWLAYSSTPKQSKHSHDCRFTPLLANACYEAILPINALYQKHLTLRGVQGNQLKGVKSTGTRFNSRIFLKYFTEKTSELLPNQSQLTSSIFGLKSLIKSFNWFICSTIIPEKVLSIRRMCGNTGTRKFLTTLQLRLRLEWKNCVTFLFNFCILFFSLWLSFLI